MAGGFLRFPTRRSGGIRGVSPVRVAALPSVPEIVAEGSDSSAADRAGRHLIPLVIPSGMAMTLRLTNDETEALRRRAALEGRSMQDVARDAVRSYIEDRSRQDLLERVLDEELPRYAEALRRLGE